MDRHEWRLRRACATADAELFFDDSGNPPSPPTEATRLRRWRAKQICATCPVAQQCLDFALDTALEYGVFGGLDQRERHVIRNNFKPRGRPLGAATLAEMAFQLGIDGLSWAEIAARLRVSEESVREACATKRNAAGVRQARFEYRAWPAVMAGDSPAKVSYRFSLPHAHAEKMCHAADNLPEYKGPKGRERYVRRDECVAH